MSTEELLPVLIVALSVAFIVILGMALALVYARGKRAGARGTLAGGQLPVGSGDADGRQVGAQVLAGQLQAVMSRLDQINQHAAEARGRDEERRQRDDKAHQWLENIAAILLGSASIGKMGERIVGEALAALPPEWVVTDFKVGDAKVEFAIKLPDGKILPIDSKMPAQSKLVELLKNIEQSEDQGKQRELEREIKREVETQVRVAQKYVDDRTPGFAIAAIPDGAYRVSGSALPTAYHRDRVVVLPYSLVIPYILMLYNDHERTDIDLAKEQTGRALDALRDSLRQLGEAHSRMAADIQTLDKQEKEVQRALTTATDALALVLSAAKERVRV